MARQWDEALSRAMYSVVESLFDSAIELETINAVEWTGFPVEKPSADDLAIDFPIERLLPEYEGETELRFGRVTHSQDILDTITARYTENALRLRRFSDEFERLDRLHSNLVIDETRFSIHYQGNECRLGNSRMFQFLKRLAVTPNQFIENRELSEASNGDDLGDNLAPVKCRLCDSLRRSGMCNVADAIVGEPGHYGLFLDRSLQASPRAIEK